MAKPPLPDGLWATIEPLRPAHHPSPKGGRPRRPDRAALTGILFVLKTGLPWEDPPAEMNCGSGMSWWRRLAEWQADGTWDASHAVLLARLAGAGRLDWSRCAADSSSVRAVFGGSIPARTRRTGARGGASTT